MPAASRLRSLPLLPFVSWLTLHAQQTTTPRAPELRARRRPPREWRDAARGQAPLRHRRPAGRRARQRRPGAVLCRWQPSRLRFPARPGWRARHGEVLRRSRPRCSERRLLQPEQHPGSFRRPPLPAGYHPRQRRVGLPAADAGLGIKHLRAVAGYSMGAQQSLQLAVSHPEFMDRAVAWCGNARTSPHGWMFLETGIRIWQADAAFAGGNYRARPMKGSGRDRGALGILGLLAGVVATRSLSAEMVLARGVTRGVV